MTIDSVFPEDLQSVTSGLGEENYVLVDVRQPQEYLEGHIPGARLIPLPELEPRLEELRRKPNAIFYCRSGARSMVAANLTVDQLGPDIRVANLVGGFSAWEGKELRDMPRLRLFQSPGNLADALLRAMDLEKGAQNFYQAAAAAAQTIAPDLARSMRTLAQVELAHARVLHYRLGQIRDQGQASFEEEYAAMAGDIIEGGLPLQEALDRVLSSSPRFCLEATELALEIELMAYDLYKNLADSEEGQTSQLFLKLAQDELGHMRLLARQLPRCPE